MKRVAGLILGGGKSQRMGSPKPLLKIFGKTFLEHIVSEASQSNLTDVKIVLGYQADLILARLPQLKADTFINPDYEQGQLSSLIKGFAGFEGSGIDGLMLFLVDHPFTSRELINKLIGGFSEHNNPIVIPTFQNKRGHPLVFGAELFNELLNAPMDQGAIAVVRKYQEHILHVEVDQEGVLIDIDTPEAYQEYVVKSGKVTAP